MQLVLPQFQVQSLGATYPHRPSLSEMERFLSACRKLGLIVREDGFEDYLHDESRFQGQASALVRARNQGDVIEIVRLANAESLPLTVVSGKTSLTGASVPTDGVVLDVKGLDKIDPDDPSLVEPGVITKVYKDWVDARGLFYPPDPTSEDSCTLGGNVACNASGALSYLYGPTRAYIQGLRMLLPFGAVLEIERGRIVSRGGTFTVPARFMEPRPSRDLVIPIPRTGAPTWNTCKNAAGLFSEEPMDLVDLFIGSEGILGVILGIKTVLLPRRKPCFALMIYLPNRGRTVELVNLLHNFRRLFHDGEFGLREELSGTLQAMSGESAPLDLGRFSGVVPSCMEWLGSAVGRFLSPERAESLARCYGALFLEQEYPAGNDPLEIASQWADLMDLIDRWWGPERGTIETEVALDEKQIRNLRKDRERVPEKLNEAVRPGMVKIGMDFSVPREHLGRLLSLYDETLPQDRTYVFGHIGNAHIHANVLPESREDAAACHILYGDLARKVCSLGGSVSGEHGIGKLKHEALEIMIGRRGIDEVRKVKRALDPLGILNVPNMVSLE